MTSSFRRAHAVIASFALFGTVSVSTVVAAASLAPQTAVDEPNIDDLEPFVDETDVPEATADFSVDRWVGIGGQSLGDVAHGSAPTESADRYGALESDVDVADDYAIRMRTLVTPDVSGRYRFWIAGDDDMRLFMNTAGDDPAGASRIAYIAGWTTYQQWNRFWSQRSVWIDLEAGVPYYLEAIGKEGSGSDHFSVAWELADGFGRELVPATALEATQLGSGGWRSATPTGLPGVPAPMTDPQWTSASGPETLALGWAPVTGAEWYEVRLEGSGQAREILVDDPAVVFDDLVPDTRYLIEVAPASAAGRQTETGRVLVTASGPYPTPVAPPTGDVPAVTYDRWDTGWWTLTSVPEGMAPASTTTLATGLETPPMQGNNHASRIRALVTPTESGVYTFHLAGDDDARLLFNAEGSWAHGAMPVAYVSGWTEQYQWNRYDSQTTQQFELQAGHQYYIEAIGVHGLGLDHLEVGWSTPGSAIEVVPADVLTPTMSGAGGWRQDASGLGVGPGPVLAVTDAWTTDTTVVIEWDAPLASDEFGVAAHYVVTIEGSGVSETVATQDTTMTFDGLAAGVEYSVAVTAVNETGAGPGVTHVVGAVVAPTTTTTPPTTTTTPPTTTTTTTTTTPTTTTTTPTTTTTTAPPTTTSTTTTTTTTTVPPSTSTTTTTLPDNADHECVTEQSLEDAKKAAKYAKKAAEAAEKAAEKAAKNADKAAQDAEKAAEKASKPAAEDAEKVAKAAKKAFEDAEKDAEKAAEAAEKAAEKVAKYLAKAAEYGGLPSNCDPDAPSIDSEGAVVDSGDPVVYLPNGKSKSIGKIAKSVVDALGSA